MRQGDEFVMLKGHPVHVRCIPEKMAFLLKTLGYELRIW